MSDNWRLIRPTSGAESRDEAFTSGVLPRMGELGACTVLDWTAAFACCAAGRER